MNVWRKDFPSFKATPIRTSSDYPDDGFDYVILSQTLQATRRRARRSPICCASVGAPSSLPNFGYWRVRAQLAFSGRMPVTGRLDYHWHDTPNIHLCTIRDFVEIVDELGAHIERARRL
jgi:methionine biosynthesis protein MetW